MDKQTKTCDLLVVGAGIAGISSALETAETGYSVSLIEKRPYIGGRVAQLNQYFPKMCPPTCGLEVNTRRIKDNPLITLYTLTEIVSIEGTAGDYTVNIKVKPRYIKEECADDELEKCSENCPVEIEDEFNYGLNKTKAVYLPSNNIWPMKYVFQKDGLTEEQVNQVKSACGSCIDLDQEEEVIELKVKAIIYATGWKPYDANNLDILGYKDFPNVITNVEMERLASPSGPTGGKIEIQGMDKEIQRVAFVQCAGSRDENHLEYCSSVCCLASMKHARFIREQYPEADIYFFYIDIRTPGAFEDFYSKTKEDKKITWHRGKVAKVIKDLDTKDLIVEAEDTLTGELKQQAVDLVVLATGMQPALNGTFSDKTLVDENGFLTTDRTDSIIGCGVATGPKDVAGVVQEATGAALKAIHIIKGCSSLQEGN
ncbi:FAD-dependent oxidoreductase [Bacteroidota bacterium]